MPSSTSSSEPRRPPWAGALALVLVLLVDATLFDRFAPWAWLRARMADDKHMELGVANDRMGLRDAAERPPRQRLVAVLGSSRAERGLRRAFLAQGELRRAAFLRLCHAGIGPYQMRALAAEVAETRPDVVVLLLSEFDTHRPPRLQTNLATGDLRAVADLARLAGAGFTLEHRDAFLGLALASLLDAYRYRDMWAAAGLSRWRNFLPDHVVRRQDLSEAPPVFDGEQPLPLNVPEALETLAQLLPDVSEQTRRAELLQLRSVARGPHVELHTRLIERTVDVFREAGAQVLIVEGPLHPVVQRIARPEPIEEFRAFARRLEQRDGVEVLWLAQSGPFPASAFGDLTHLDDLGTARLCSAVRARVAEMLRDDG